MSNKEPVLIHEYASVEEALQPYCQLEFDNDPSFLKIIGWEEYRVNDGILYFNDDPKDDIELKHITKVWHFNSDSRGYDLVWKAK